MPMCGSDISTNKLCFLIFTVRAECSFILKAVSTCVTYPKDPVASDERGRKLRPKRVASLRGTVCALNGSENAQPLGAPFRPMVAIVRRI